MTRLARPDDPWGCRSGVGARLHNPETIRQMGAVVLTISPTVFAVDCAEHVYPHPTESAYRGTGKAFQGHDGATRAPEAEARNVGPTADALEALDRATAGARLVRRTGPALYVVVE